SQPPTALLQRGRTPADRSDAVAATRRRLAAAPTAPCPAGPADACRRMGPVVAAPDRTVARPEAARISSGARSGAVVAGASAVSIVANYVFLLAAGRVLGSAGYGSLAALLGLLAVVLIPAGALQMAVSREISRRIASDDAAGARVFARTVLRLAAIATVPPVAGAFGLAAPFA